MNDVSSPPYPSMEVMTPTLYHHIVDFRVWWEDHREQLRELVQSGHPVGSFVDDDPDPTASESAWDVVSIMDKARVLLYMRMIREVWDAILRDHEDAWESDMSIRRQIYLLYAGRDFLNNVWLTPEQREARVEKERPPSQPGLKRFDDVSIKLPDDFTVEDIVGENFDPDAEEDDETE